MSLWILFAFIFGAVVGSFLNVLVLRYNTGRMFRGRSACGVCGRILSPIDLFPILSFLFLGGKCRYCETKISPQYPLVEFATAIAFALVVWKGSMFGDLAVLFILFGWVISALLIAIATYDILHKIIPDGLVYTFDVVVFVWVFILAGLSVDPLMLGIIIVNGVVVALPFALLWLLSRGRWMGLGDAKLALGIGFLFGISGGFTALILAVWAGAIVSIALLAIGKLSGKHGLTLKSEIPFGPFLVLATLFVFLSGIDLFSLLTL
ncbi:MAG: prepilin peptidase [Patescibacteria group bacterium]